MYDAAGGSSRGYYLTTGVVVYNHEPSNNRSYIGVWFDLHAGSTYFIGHNLSGGFAWYANGNYIGGWSPSGQYSVPQNGYTRLYWWEGWIGHDVNGGLSMSSNGNLQMVNQSLNYSLPYITVSGSGTANQNYDRRPYTPSVTSGTRNRNTINITVNDPGAMNSGPARDYYQYRWAPSGGGYTEAAYTSGRSWTFTAPSHTVTYNFQFRAYNSDGWGDWGNTWTVAGAPNTPSGPTILPNAQNSGSSIIITSNVPSNNGAGITAYQYRYMPSDGSFTEVTQTSGNSWELAIPNNLKHYLVSTRALNSSGWSDWSVTSPGIPGRPPTITTNTPVGLKATVYAGQAVSTNAITEYYVSASKDNGVTWETEIPMGLDREYEYVGLSGGKNYIFRVRAFNSTGASTYTTLSTPVFVPAGGKRWTGQGFVPTAIVKRKTDSGWETVTIAKRWNGSGWEVLT